MIPEYSDFHKRMTESRRREAVSRAWVQAFVNGFAQLAAGRAEPVPRQLLTAEEVARLEFLRYRLDRGEVES